MAKKITKQQIVDYWETRVYEGNIGTDWDAATEVKSNFKVYLNKGTLQEVVMNIVRLSQSLTI